MHYHVLQRKCTVHFDEAYINYAEPRICYAGRVYILYQNHQCESIKSFTTPEMKDRARKRHARNSSHLVEYAT